MSVIAETERLVIRELLPEDAGPFAAMAADGGLNDVGFDSGASAWMPEWITEAAKFTEADNPCAEYMAYAIVLKDGGETIGSVGCSRYDDLDRTRVTYFIGAEHRENGYAAEAVRVYVEHFAKRYDMTLIATVREANTASWKTVERAGFTLMDKRMYRDINDECEQLYRFYEK